MREMARGLLLSALRRRSTPYAAADLARTAVVLAPHQDDETLGCGGTIALKRRAGARVAVVFLTDGSRSHERFLDRESLRALREAEARAACRALGVADGDVHFLGIRDGRLAAEADAAIARTAAILLAYRPDEVFAPYRNDGPSDHEAACFCARAAVAAAGLDGRVDLYEYPIWYWMAFPLAGLGGGGGGGGRLRELARGARRGLRFLRDFRCRVDVRGVLAQKRAALAEHRTQTERLGGPAWPTLADVRGGDLLRCCLGEDEIFRRTRAAVAGAVTPAAA